jgi:type III secretion protein T
MDNIVTSTDSYLSLLLDYTLASPITVLAAFFLVLARMLPIMLLAPFFGARRAPNTMKMMFAIALCAILFPQVVINLKKEIPLNLLFAGLALKELLFGFILGFLVAIPFYAAQASGSLIDHIRGASSLQIQDPTTQTKTGPIGIFYNYILIVIFFAIGGPFYFINALSQSFYLVPINEVLNPAFFSLNVSFWKIIIGLLHHVLSLAIQLGAPSIIGILMAEMFLGIANRLAPQVQIVFLGISLKSFVGLALLAAAWFFILNQLGKESLAWIKIIQKTVQQIAPIR